MLPPTHHSKIHYQIRKIPSDILLHSSYPLTGFSTTTALHIPCSSHKPFPMNKANPVYSFCLFCLKYWHPHSHPPPQMLIPKATPCKAFPEVSSSFKWQSILFRTVFWELHIYIWVLSHALLFINYWRTKSPVLSFVLPLLLSTVPCTC